jgi:hypothetical protein
MLIIEVRCDTCGVTGKMKKFSKVAVKGMRTELEKEGWIVSEGSLGPDFCTECNELEDRPKNEPKNEP